MRDARIGLLILGVGLASAMIKRSKSLSKYVGEHLVHAGEYFLAEKPPVKPEPEPEKDPTLFED